MTDNLDKIYFLILYYMKFSLKKTFSKHNMAGVKKGLTQAGRIAQKAAVVVEKAGQVGAAFAPVLMLGGPEMAPAAAGLEAGSLAAIGVGKAVQAV